MRRHKVGILVVLFLISFVSFAFASMSLMLPIERNPNPFNSAELILPEPSPKESSMVKSVPSSSHLNYQAWRRIQTSA